MKTNLVILTKEKLISIDAILPLLLELKHDNPTCNIVIVLPSPYNLDLIKKNIHIYNCLTLLNSKILAPRRDNKLIILFFLVKLMCQLAFSRNIFIKFADTLFKHKLFMKILKKISRTVEVFTIIHSPVRSFTPRYATQCAYISKQNPENFKLNFFEALGDDLLLTSITAEDLNQYYNYNVKNSYLYVGYPRTLEQWNQFIQNEINNYPIINNKKYFVYNLSTLKNRLDSLNEPYLEELLKETLDILKDFSKEIHTIFKPHPITDLNLFKNILNDVGYENFSIDYGHPMVLASKAEFCIVNTWSNTVNDAYYQGTPVIEYCSYDKGLTQYWDKYASGWKYTDFFIDRDPILLRDTVASILSGEVEIVRDEEFLRNNFPHTPSITKKRLNELFVH